MSGRLLSLAALVLAVCGVTFNFLPQETGARLGIGPSAGAVAMLELLGVALLGFAAVDWMSRGAPVGGIYGRPLALGNLLLFGAGGLSLARGATAGGPAELLGPAAAVFLALAAAFAWLTFGKKGPANDRGR